MRFKRAMAASMAAVMAVSSAVVCQVTASAVTDEALSTGSIGSAVLIEDSYNQGFVAKPEVALDTSWSNAKSFSGYGKIEVSYTCDAVDEIANIYI